MSRPENPLISIVVPMKNEAEVIDVFFVRILSVLRACANRFEIVCIDDGSTDNTARILMQKQAVIPEIRLIRLSRNFGKEAALTAGIDVCRGDVVVPIDADLQDPPEILPEMLFKWRSGADVVVAVRTDRNKDTAFKRWSAKTFYRFFNRISEVTIPENAGDFRLMDRRVINVLILLPERSRFMKGLFSWVGFKTETVEFTREERVAGESKWHYWRLWNFALDGIFSFTTVPLRIWTYIGLLSASLAVLYMFTIILRVLALGVDVPGYASSIVVLLFSLSLNMVGIGILGEYVGRIFHEVKARPLYVVLSDTGAPQSATVDNFVSHNRVGSEIGNDQGLAVTRKER